MAKSIRANLELVSEREVQKIERLDVGELSSTPDSFIRDNLLGYYVLINTWLLLIQQWSRYGWMFVRQYLLDNGLINTIRQFEKAATELINGSDVSFSLAHTIYKDVCDGYNFYGIPHDNELSVHQNPLSAMLLLCRFPKRFSPVKADLLRGRSLQEFIQTQRELKLLQRHEPSRFVLQSVKDVASRLIDWDGLVNELSKVHISDISFTSGVSYSTKADLVSKLRATAAERVEYFYQPLGVPLVCHGSTVVPNQVEYWGAHKDLEVHCVRLSPVPKNYKTARIIAPEDVVRQALARRYFTIADAYLPSLINLHDQTQNQILAAEGSMTCNLATIDLHAASDRISRSILMDILPPKFTRLIDRILPTHFECGGKRYRMESAATMGNSMTFWLESVVFAAISVAATEFFNRMTGNSNDTVSVYGDDIIVPAMAAPTVMEWLTECGFVVNYDKTFWCDTPAYRESCGVEYLDGVNISSRYFPRFPLLGALGSFSDKAIRDSFTGESTTTLSALVDLQHKLFNVCVPAALLVEQVIREAEPRMTTSAPESPYMDIWSYECRPKWIPAPAAIFVNGKLTKTVVEGMDREAHLTPITTYPKVDLCDQDKMLVDLYKYQRFLKYGPTYDTPLDRLLGVSSSPLTYEEAASQGEVKWVYVK